MKNILIELTEKQGEQIAELWKKHGSGGKAMLAQPGNIVDGRYTKIKIVILDEEQAEKVAHIANPPNEKS
jgi:hypothetical protein